MRILHLRWLCALLLIGFTVAQVRSQPAMEFVDSIDFRVLDSKAVVVGTITDFGKPENARVPVTVTVQETLNGEPQATFHTEIPYSVDEVRFWKAHSTRLLVMLSEGFWRRWVTDLDDKHLVVSKEDFTLIQNPDELLGYVRELIRKNLGADRRRVFYRFPPDDEVGRAWRHQFPRHRFYVVLVVPADALLERLALEWIHSESVEQRAEGAKALGLFRSEANIAHLKRLLKDPGSRVQQRAENNNGIETRYYSVRGVADNILKNWGVKVERVTVEERVSMLANIESVSWSGRLTDADFEALRTAKRLKALDIYVNGLSTDQLTKICRFKNLTHLRLPWLSVKDTDLHLLAALPWLRSLTIDKNPITDAGLSTLSRFQNLKELNVSGTEVTDDGLADLRHVRPDLEVFPEKAVSILGLYVGRDDLEGVRRVLDLNPTVVDSGMSDFYGGTPLHLAAFRQNYDTVMLLLDRGAKVNALDSEGRTPLQTAANNNVAGRSNYDLIRLLLTSGASPVVNTKDRPGYMTPDDHSVELVAGWAAIKRKPVSLIPQTRADCRHYVYALSKSNPKLANWSSRTLGRLIGPVQWSRSPSGRDYIGPFGQQATTFRLGGLPTHSNVHVEIELFVIGSWDGNGGFGNGPDILDIQVPNIGTALHSTFFNNTEGDAANIGMQSFPDPFPLGYHPGYTGASKVRALGFTEPWGGVTYHRDAAYKLQFTFAHTGSEIEIVISGLTHPQPNIQNLAGDENWGIASFEVTTD